MTRTEPNLTAPPRAAVPPRRPRVRSRVRPGRPARRALVTRGIQLLALCALFGAWELFASVGIVNGSFTSRPSEFIPAFWHELVHGDLLSLMGVTLYEAFAGFAIAAVSGLLVGALLAESRAFDTIARPFLTGFNNLPRIALIPLYVLWFGLGSWARIVLIFTLGFFVVAFNTHAGLQNASRDHMLLAQTLGASRWTRFRRFVLPAALPSVFAGLQLCLSYAFLGAVAGEMLTGSQGLGGWLALQMGTFQTGEFFGGLLLLLIVSLAISGAFRWLERRLLWWREVEMRGAQGRT